MPPGVYFPKCEEDGRFKKVQCLASTEECWCVTDDGFVIWNTAVRGKPNCVKKGTNVRTTLLRNILIIIIIIILYKCQGALIGDTNEMNSNQIKYWFLWRGKNRTTRRKTYRSRQENKQTQPTYDVESENRIRATLVGSECSHHCAIPGHGSHLHFDNCPKSRCVNMFAKPDNFKSK